MGTTLLAICQLLKNEGVMWNPGREFFLRMGREQLEVWKIQE
jgi:hypothetical protein